MDPMVHSMDQLHQLDLRRVVGFTRVVNGSGLGSLEVYEISSIVGC